MRRFLPLLLCWPLLMGAAASSRIYDGTNDETDFGAVLDVTTNDVSQCIWVNTTEDASVDFIQGKKNGTGTAAGYLLACPGTDTITFHIADGTDESHATGSSDNDGVWVFACGTWNAATTTASIYVNETLEDTTTNALVGSLTNAVNFQVGEGPPDDNDANMLAAYGQVYLSKVLTLSEMAEAHHKIGSLAADFLAPLVGDNPEPDWQGKLSGTVSGTDASSTSGPPTMMGPWGAAP